MSGFGNRRLSETSPVVSPVQWPASKVDAPADLILTLNSRFVPGTRDDSYGFGVVGFVTALAGELSARDRLGGVILYERARGRATAPPRRCSFLGFPACHVILGDDMSVGDRQTAFERGVRMCRRLERPAVVYHQTNTLLTATPTGMPAMVTHHAPFASEVCRLFGLDLARTAFQGGREKLTFLLGSQAQAIKYLRQHPEILCVELSGVQERVLRQAGIPAIARLPPPVSVGSRGVGAQTTRHPERPGIHVVSATARIDAFKNLTLLAEAANAVAAEGTPVRLTLFVGTAEEATARALLRSELRADVASMATIRERLSHQELLAWMAERRGDTVFVCPSLYETLGITALEAISSGMTTLVTNSDHVGVGEYVPPGYRFEPTVDGLARTLVEMARRGRLEETGAAQREHAGSLTGAERCAVEICTLADRAHSLSEAVSCGPGVCPESVPSRISREPEGAVFG
jgi:glycosyltransferase involved in cell wall biosynthesis